MFFFFASAISILVNSQNSCGDYTVTRTTGITYSSIQSTGNSVPLWRNTSNPGVGGGADDDNRSYGINIGFDFWYLGVRYTSFCLSTNGYIDFSASTADGTGNSTYGYQNTVFTNSSAAKKTLLCLAPFYEDQTTHGNSNPLGDNIKYLVSGTAPNRALTIEWVDMCSYSEISGNKTLSSLNYQVVLHETTGIIEYNYGTMTQGGNSWSFSCGINGTNMSGTPTTAQLLTQQTVNTASFNANPNNSLTPIPTSNTKLTFTPPTPSGNPSSLTFTSLLQTGVTLNWNGAAVTNEAGFVIYYSTDNVNFYFNTQTAANATSAAVTGLTPATTYYWNLYAVTDGYLSSAATGSCVTNPATVVTSTLTGNWATAATWDCNCIPNANDNVIIADGTIVTINANSVCNSLQVGQGLSGNLIMGSNGTARTLAITTDLTIKSSATFTTFALAAAHTLSIGRNIINSGTLNFSGTSTCDVTFNSSAYPGNIGNQTVSGSGATTKFNNIILNMGSSNTNIMEVTATNFSAPSNFLTLTNGTFKLSSGVTITPFTSTYTILSSAGLWVNNASATVSGKSGTSISLQGLLRVTAGTMTVGGSTTDNLTYDGGTLTVDGGTLNVTGNFTSFDATSTVVFTISSGTLTVATSGATNVTGVAPFNINVSGCTFNMNGGTIVIQNSGKSNLGFFNSISSLDIYTVTGGTLQMGNASTPAATTMQINSTVPVYNLTINSSNVTTQITTNSLTVNNNVNIASGILNANALNLTTVGNFTVTGTYQASTGTTSIAGNLVNNGTFTQSTSTVLFNGSSAQTLGGSSNTTFNNVSINNSNGTVSGVTVNTTATINGALTFSAGIFNTSASGYLIMANAATTSGASNSSYVDGPIQKTGQQTFTFPVGTGGNYQPIKMGAPTNTTDAFTAQYFHSNVYAVPSYTTNTWDATINHLSGCEYWILNRTAGTSSVAVTIGWNASSCSVTNLAQLTVAKYDATLNAWKNVGNAGTTGNTTAGTITSNVVGSFSPFTLGSTTSANPLPIELLSFSAIPNGEKVDLSWETATEINNAYFTIEKSKDGVNFTKLIDMPGADNSTSNKYYAETDYQPYSGTSYYRLKQTDNNGNFKYFSMVPVNFDNLKKITVYPNPIDNSSSLTVKVSGYKSQEIVVVLRDIQGKEFLSKVLLSTDNDQVFMVDETQMLAPGTYIITASSNDKIYNYKLIVK